MSEESRLSHKVLHEIVNLIETIVDDNDDVHISNPYEMKLTNIRNMLDQHIDLIDATEPDGR